jgi:hypothetical protein
MDRTLIEDVQRLIDACEKVIRVSSDNNGLSQEDCDAVLFYARELIREIKPSCTENHETSKNKKWVTQLPA